MNIKSEIKLLKAALSCAEQAGILDKVCLGFGTMLGAVRPTIRTSEIPTFYKRGLMEHDHDSDLCFLNISKEEKEEYFKLCKEAGLFEWKAPHTPQERISRKQNGEILWFSLVEPKRRARCCQWMCFDYNGWMWHTKGSRWLGKFNKKKYRHTDKCDAIMKGTPSRFYENLTEIDFEGFKVQVPSMSGSLLDEWYPGWAVPKKGGASSKKSICVVENWENKKTWRIF